MKGSFRSGFYQLVRVFLLLLLAVGVYAGNASGDTYLYDSTLGVTGVTGTDNSHFNNPSGVAVDGLGNVYVADSTNHRIQKYDSTGAYVSTLGVTGVSGTDNSHFNNPSGAAVDGSGNVYVADTDNHRIQKFNSSGVYQSTLGVTGVTGTDNSHFTAPIGVAVDGSGNLYVADTNNHRIQKFNSSGVYQSTLGVTGVTGTDNSHFNNPSGVAVDGSVNVYVADTSNHRIQKFDSTGAYVSTLGVTGVTGTDNSHFDLPDGVAVDGSGNLYVADTSNHRIQQFDASGAYVSTLGVTGVTGTDNSHFNIPTGVAVHGSGTLYVADINNQRIQKYVGSSIITPVAAFNWSKDATTSYKINFDATSSTCPGGHTCTYNWAFGDTQTGTGIITSHTYANTTSQTVTLTVVTDVSTQAGKSKIVTPIVINKPPVAKGLSTAPITFVQTNKTVSFTDASTDPNGDTLTTYVDWGDGSALATGTATTVWSHTYTLNGKFKITHTAKDPGGLSNKESQTVTIANTPATTGSVTISSTRTLTPITQKITYYIKTSAGLTKKSGSIAVNGSTGVMLFPTGDYKVYLYFPAGGGCTTSPIYSNGTVFNIGAKPINVTCN